MEETVVLEMMQKKVSRYKGRQGQTVQKSCTGNQLSRIAIGSGDVGKVPQL